MKSGSSQSKSHQSPNLMSLPDEVHLQIFQKLGVSSTANPSQTYYDAFSLAQTNRHFLRIFGTMIDNINPSLEDYISQYASPSHLLPIARIAGDNLREIHIPRGGFYILSKLLQHCPNVGNLHLVQDTNDSVSVLSGVLNFNLRRLSIHNPQLDFLRIITSPPIEITLTGITDDCLEYIPRILRDPPKELVLRFEFVTLDPPGFSETVACIAEACPNVEKLQVTVKPSHGHRSIRFYEEAQKLISDARRNSENSSCRSISLDGSSAFKILSKAHPMADIHLTSHDITFSDEGDGIYATGLVLEDEFRELDLSRLRRVHIGMRFNSFWAEALGGLQLDSAVVENVAAAALLRGNLSVKIVLVSHRALMNAEVLEDFVEWDWLPNTRQLRFPAPSPLLRCCSGFKTFFRSVRQILSIFAGDAVHLSTPHPSFRIKRCRGLAPLPEGRLLLSILENFERGGTNVESVKEFVHEWIRKKEEMLEHLGGRKGECSMIEDRMTPQT